MKNVTSKPALSHSAIETNSHLFDDWFDPIENMIRGQVRGLIEEMIRGELDAALSRPRYGRRAGPSEGGDVDGHPVLEAKFAPLLALARRVRDQERGQRGPK